MQAAYEEFGCNDGNVFFLGIDKGNTNEDVIYFDSVYNVHYPGVSGQEGGGNEVHLDWQVQGTPSVVIIQPDRVIAVKQIFPPNTDQIVDSVINIGGILQSCMTSIAEVKHEELMTISPNPANNFTYVNLNLAEEKELQIKVFNITGQVVQTLEPKYYPAGKFILKLDLSNEKSGFHFVQAIDNNEVVATTKLILR